MAWRGAFWFRAHALAALFQLLPEHQMHLRDLQRQMGLGGSGGGVIGMHIRRGDACAASVGYRTPCQPLEAYLRAAEALAARYDVSEVFVASDDGDALAALSARRGGVLRFFSTPHDRTMLRSDWYVEERIRRGLLDAAAAGESAVVDLALLAACDYFVGTFSSHFSALALELMAAHKGFLPPYISLDLPWAPRH